MNLRNKLINNIKANRVEYLFLTIIGILFYCLNSLSEISWDDYYYMFICKDAHFFGDYHREYVQGFADVIRSQINHWNFVNGRFIVHVIVQLFVCILGLPLFQICNSIIFVLLIKYFCKLCIETSCRDNTAYYIFLFFVVWGLLGFMCVGLGYITSVAFAVNYLWSSTLYVWFIYNYYKHKNTLDKTSVVKKVSLFVFAILTGAMNESFSVGLSASLFVYFVFCGNKKQLTGPVAVLTFGLWIGTILCCVNPANLSRFTENNEAGFVRELSLRGFWLGSNLRLLVPILVAMSTTLFVYFKNKQILKNICYKYIEVIIAVFCTFLFLVVVGLKGNYQMFIGITLLSAFWLYKLLEKAFPNMFHSKIIVALLTICLSIHYITVICFSHQQIKDYNANIREYISSKGIIEYTPPKASAIVAAYGIYLPDSRKGFIYSGLELVYGYQPKFIPERSVLTNLDDGELYDAGWCYVVPMQDDIKYDVIVVDFTHKNWMLKIWSKLSNSATTRFKLESYEVECDNRKYIIALKKNDDFIINDVSLIKQE